MCHVFSLLNMTWTWDQVCDLTRQESPRPSSVFQGVRFEFVESFGDTIASKVVEAFLEVDSFILQSSRFFVKQTVETIQVFVVVDGKHDLSEGESAFQVIVFV